MRLAAWLLLLSLATPLSAADTYVIAGTVVHSVTRAPLAKVQMFLAVSMSSGKPVSTRTGADGRFQFTQVPAGKYTLTAERNGFVPRAYNQRRLFQRYSSAVVTGPQENTTDLVFTLVPGAVVSGRATDVNGDPVPWARAEVYRVTGAGERRGARRMGAATTDDQGSFRIANLPEGRYVLSIQGKPWYADARRSDSGDVPAYPLTFYPSTTDPAAAEFIDLSAGREFQAYVTMAPVPTCGIVVKRPANIQGRVPFVAFGGPSVYGVTSYSQRSVSLYSESTPMRVPAGRYQFILSQGQDSRLAVLDVDVSRNDQQIEFDASPLAGVRGVLEVVGNRVKLGIQPGVLLSGVDSDAVFMRAVEPDGTFQMSGIPKGAYVAALNTRSPFPFRSITAKGASVRDGLIIMPATGTVELKLVVDTDVAEIEGRLLSGGRGVSGALVVVTAKDRLQDTWLHRMDQTDSDGSFAWRGMSAGDYLAFVFPEGDEALASDPDYLQRFLDTAIPFTVQGTAKQKLELTLPKL